MNVKNRIYLVDVDNTLLNTERLKRLIGINLKKKFGTKISLNLFWQKYDSVIKKYGYNDINKLSESISKQVPTINRSDILNIFYNVNFKACLDPLAIKFIKQLQKTGVVVIYSLGHPNYQKVKINSSGLEKLVGSKNIIIVQDKILGLKRVLRKFLSNYSNVFIIDDRSDVLEEARSFNDSIITVWIRYGKYKSVVPKNYDLISFETNNLYSALKYLENFKGVIYSNLLNKHFSIVKEITHLQIARIVQISQKDLFVKRFTHDKFRFKSVKSFLTWSKRGKKIYVLMDNKSRIFGIIWFSKKKLPKSKYRLFLNPIDIHTFAIRLYRPVRGKHLSEKFAKIVFKDFNPDFVWLTTKKDNLSALKLYTKCKFKKVDTTPEGNILMVFQNKSLSRNFRP